MCNVYKKLNVVTIIMFLRFIIVLCFGLEVGVTWEIPLELAMRTRSVWVFLQVDGTASLDNLARCIGYHRAGGKH